MAAYNNKEVQQAVRVLIDATNSMSLDEEALAKVILAEIQNSHRTLQQSFWKVFSLAIAEYSKTKYFDLRNLAAVDWAKAVAKIEHNFPFI